MKYIPQVLLVYIASLATLVEIGLQILIPAAILWKLERHNFFTFTGEQLADSEFMLMKAWYYLHYLLAKSIEWEFLLQTQQWELHCE